MAIRKCFIGLAIVSIAVIGIVFLGCVPQVAAETLNFKLFNHVTKNEMVPIPDVEGHVTALSVREGVAVFANREWAWLKAINMLDFIRGAGPFDAYVTFTFLDGSSVTARAKGVVEATPQGVTSAIKWAGDIIHGTGRFQGTKGTVTTSAKLLPPEKGEPGPKVLGEGTLVYTLPGK